MPTISEEEIQKRNLIWEYDAIKDTLYLKPKDTNSSKPIKKGDNTRVISSRFSNNGQKITVIDEFNIIQEVEKKSKNIFNWKILNYQNFQEYELKDERFVNTISTVSQKIERNSIGGGVGFCKKFNNIDDFYKKDIVYHFFKDKVTNHNYKVTNYKIVSTPTKKYEFSNLTDLMCLKYKEKMNKVRTK